jgi:hypothetical protein
MRAYSWFLLGSVALGCSGGAFSTGDGEGGSGTGGSAGDGAAAGVLGRAGRNTGGTKGSGGSDSTGGASGGSASGGSGANGGVISVGGDLGIAGDLVAGGTLSVGGDSGTGMAGAPTEPDVCPLHKPTAAEMCAPGLKCTYGKDVRSQCRDHADCVKGAWDVGLTVCKAAPACAAAVTPGAVCDANSAGCTYNDTQYCYCSACIGNLCGPKTVWHCSGGGDEPNCPALAPNEGQPCTEQLKCRYGACGYQNTPIDAVCDGQTWSWAGVVCPL